MMNLRYGKVFKIPRRIVKYGLSLLYPVVIKIWPLPKVLSIDETIDKILNEKCSISRFGDGEFLYIIDKLNLPFQRYDKKLADKLISILKSKNENILIGLPIGYHSLNNLRKESKLTWRSQIAWVYPRLYKYIDRTSIYYNSSFTRPYLEYESKELSSIYFKKIKQIWEGRDIIIIEGEKSRLGVGNDLFNGALSVKRILAPMHHAFSKYDELLNEAKKYPNSKLFLIALGPTATALAYDLATYGYQAIDIGNIDIEYEWYLRGAKEKIKIPGKYTSEAPGGRNVEDIEDENYEKQIVARII